MTTKTHHQADPGGPDSPPSAPSPAIELIDLVKTFRAPRRQGGAPVRAVDGLSLRIEPGEVVAFLGPNGAGKTTTLDVVLGLTEPTSGTARVLGRRPREAVRAGAVSAVLQSGGLLGDLTVRETVELIASTFAAPAGVDEVLGRAGLADLGGRMVSKCSGGEQQRLRFALALLPQPALLVLDEPTAGMDVAARREFWATMRADADQGRTIVFATHYLEEADAFADRIVLVAGGRVVADGTTADIRGRASHHSVSADLPEDPGVRRRVLDHVASLPGVTSSEQHGRRVVVSTSDSDTVARALLVDLDLHHLEITTQSLESAFVSLTGTPAEESTPMSTTFLRLELRRFFRNYAAVFFVASLPAFFYLVFGAAQSYGPESAGNGNVTMYIMISMAAYGAVTATSGIGGNAAVERMQGWGRQLGLTPPSPTPGFVVTKGMLSLIVAAIPITLTFVLGALTGAAGSAARLGARRRGGPGGRVGLLALRPGDRPGLPLRGRRRRRRGWPGHHGVPRQHLRAALGHAPGHREVHPALRLRRAGPLPHHRGQPHRRER